MTTITIEQDIKGLKKTEFETLDELAEFVFSQYADSELPELTNKEIQMAQAARKEIEDKPESFQRVTRS